MPSLLYQLVSDEVVSENSCVLQCLKFVVDEGLIPLPKGMKREDESDDSSDGSSDD